MPVHYINPLDSISFTPTGSGYSRMKTEIFHQRSNGQADTFLVLRTLLNCLACIIFWNCYKKTDPL